MAWISDPALSRLRSAMDEPDLTGTRYRLLEKIGQGGMAGVFRVEDTVLGREVAMKVISLPEAGGDDLALRLMQEARVIARLEHPGIVPVHDAGKLADGRVYYTMKLAPGTRLDDLTRRPGALAERLRIFEKICEAVSFAHARGVLHRDLKPENIMAGRFGEVLVMDWGLAKVIGGGERPGHAANAASGGASEPQTGHGTVMGTPGYMAPEQERGDSAGLDERSDVYSLGAILNFLLADGSRRDAPRRLRAMVAKAMAADPGERYLSAEELREDVRRHLDGLSVSAYREGPLERLARWAARNRAWLLLVLAYLLMRVVFILWSVRER